MDSACRFCCIVAWLLCLVEVCRGVYISAGGTTTISLNGYSNREHRTWTVSTESRWRIRISFSYLDTEGCCDRLQITDTSTGQLWTFGGSSRPDDVVSTGNNLQLTFTSDFSVTAGGFSLSARSIPQPAPPVTSSISLRDSTGTVLLGDVYVLEGAPFAFTCDVQGTSPAATIRWYLDGALQETADAPSGGDDSFVDTSDTWTLAASSANHGQEVKCVASNTASQEPFPYIGVTLDVIVLPTAIELWDSSDNSTTNNGTSYLVAEVDYQFTCVVPGIRPSANLSWSLGGLAIAEDSGNDTTDADGLMTSTSVVTLSASWAVHGEDLQCLATNYGGFPVVNVSSTIDVKVPPTPSSLAIYDAEGTRLGPTVTVLQGVAYNFTCEVHGTRPAATVTWHLDGTLQRTATPPSGVGDNLVDTADSWELAPNRSIHGQQLRCTARTPDSQGPLPFVTTTLNVNVLPTVISLHDSAWNSSFVNETSYLTAGVAHEFVCEVPGIDPAASVIWTLGGGQGIVPNLTTDVVGPDGLITTRSTVVVTPTWSDHGAVLQCNATNKAGHSGLTSGVVLDVKVPPQESSVFLLDIDGIRQETLVDVEEGVPKAFACVVQGTRPAATVEWYLGGVLQSTVGPAEGGIDGLVNTTATWMLIPETKHHRLLLMCSASTAESSHPFPSANVSLNVKVLPTEIAIFDASGNYSSNDTAYLIEGVDHRFACVVPDINPGASFTWALADQELRSHSSEVARTSGFRTSTSHVRMAPSWANHGQALQCRATNRDGHNGISTAVVLDIKVPPRPSSVSLYDSNGTSLVSTYIVDQGSLSSLQCEVLGTRPAVAIEWFLNGTLVKTTAAPFREDTGLVDTLDTWLFTPGRANHGQEVTCVASTAESQEPFPSKSLNLEVRGPPDRPWIVGDTTLTEGIATTLTCYSDMGFPDDWLLFWSFGDTYDLANLTTVPSLSGGRFLFTSALNVTPTRDDNGKTIACTARKGSDGVGLTTTFGPVDVHFCPRRVSITDCPLKATPGSSVSLNCVTDSSNPMSNLTWLRNGRRLTNPARPALADGDHGGHVTAEDFTTGALNKEDNGALWTCCADETATCPSDVCDSCSLNVEYRPYFFEPTRATPSPVREGDDVILSCRADANPAPPGFITWEKVGSAEPLRSVYSDGASVLTLRGVARGRAGPYRCRGNNGVPPVVFSNPISIAVYYEVNITSRADTYVGAADGEGAVLRCSAAGNPLPLIVWSGPSNQEINDDTDPGRIAQRVTVNGGDDLYGYAVTGTLHVRRVTAAGDYGRYTCYSGNGVGRVDVLHIHLGTAVLPAAPTNVSIQEAANTATSITVSWTPGSAVAPDTWFRVNYREPATADGFDPSTLSGRLRGVASFTLRGLRPHSVYEVEVYAENANGASEAVRFVGTTQLCTRMVSVTGCPYRIVSGTSLSLSCISESTVPATNLTWLRDNVERASQPPPVLYDGDYGGRVTTLDLTTGALTRADHGVRYKCCAVRPSVCTVDMCDTCALNVEYRPFFSDPVVLTPGPVQEGDDVVVACTADANPMPPGFIAWEKVGSPDSLTAVDGNATSTLTLRGVTREQTGSYRCCGNNGIPPVAFSTPVDVIVHFGVTITNPESDYVEASVGESAALVCTAKGNPRPMMTWLSPTGTRITNQSRLGGLSLGETTSGRGGVEGHTVTSTLQIGPVSAADYGYYVCGSGNGIGMVDTLTVLLSVRVYSVAPTNVSIDRGRTTVTTLTVTWISWKADVGPEQWTVVNYRELDTTTAFAASMRSGRLYDSSEYTVVGLRPDTDYAVAVYAENANGPSDVVTRIAKTLPEVGNTTPRPLIGSTHGTSVGKTETSTTLLEVETTTRQEVSAETSAATQMSISEFQSDQKPEGRAYMAVEKDDSGLVVGVVLMSMVASVCIVIIVAMFVYHHRSTTNTLEITGPQTKLTQSSIKYEDESDEKVESFGIPLQDLSSDYGEVTHGHGSVVSN